VKEVTIGVNTFQVRTLPVYPDQLLLTKSFMPLYGDLMPVIMKAMKDPAIREAIKAKAPPVDFLLEVADAVFVALQKLSSDDLLELTRRALIAVQVKQGTAGWSNLMLDNGQLMFQTLALPELLQLVWVVVEVNLLDFFAAPLGKSQGGAVAA
jgi:hypothetical protein